jgi:hypothetical protein
VTLINDLVETYRDDKNLIDTFGIILYTDEHANIVKVLRDDDYWKSFHETSGPNWAIFSIKPRKGHFSMPDFGPNQMGMMIPIWKEPSENNLLLKEFNLESTQNLPLFLIFTPAVEEILQIHMKIDDHSIDNAYASIKDIILVVSKAVKGILSKNYKNPEGVYAAISLALDNHRDIKRLKKTLDFYAWIKRHIP